MAGLGAHAATLARDLSGGMRRKLELAMSAAVALATLALRRATR